MGGKETQMKVYLRLVIQIMWTILFVAGCSKSETIVPTTTKESLITTSITKPTKTPYPSRTPKPTLTFTSTPDFESIVFQPRNSKELQDFVIFNTNQGKTIVEINAFFGQNERRQVWIDGKSVDFDGDGVYELFLTTSFYPEGQDHIENSFLVMKKTQGQYFMVYSKLETAYYIPKIELVDDFNGDNISDLVFTRPVAGNGVGADLFIVRQEKSGINISQVGETELIIDKIFASDNNTDSTKNLVIIGFESGWGSSGPGRTIEETYAINDRGYALLQSNYLPDKFRIHVLQDAQIAYNAGDEEIAVKLWEQAAVDVSLENFPSMWIENDIPERYQPAFALYRLYTYHLSINDTETAQKYWKEMNNKYPPGSPGGEFVELGSEAKHLLDISQDPALVCDGIYEFLNSTIEWADFLIDHWYWGDYNLDIVDFCPVRR